MRSLKLVSFYAMRMRRVVPVVCAVMLPELSKFFSEGMGMTLASETDNCDCFAIQYS